MAHEPCGRGFPSGLPAHSWCQSLPPVLRFAHIIRKNAQEAARSARDIRDVSVGHRPPPTTHPPAQKLGNATGIHPVGPHVSVGILQSLLTVNGRVPDRRRGGQLDMSFCARVKVSMVCGCFPLAQIFFPSGVNASYDSYEIGIQSANVSTSPPWFLRVNRAPC